MLVCLLYPFTKTRCSKVSSSVFRNLASFLAHFVLIKANAFALELAKAIVFTLHLLQDKVQGIVKLFLLNN